MSTELLIQQDTGIGPFCIGQSFREVVHLCRDLLCIQQPSSIEYSDEIPFNEHLIIRSTIRIGDELYGLLLGFESYTQKLHILKLYPETNDHNLSLGYSKEDSVIKIGVKDYVGYRSLENLANFLKIFRKKSLRFEESKEARVRVLQTYEEDAKSHTKFIFKSTTIEEDDAEFRSVSSVQTYMTDSITSEISRADSAHYKLKSVVILASTYTTHVPEIPTPNLTLPTYTYDSSRDFIHLSRDSKTHILNTTCSVQEILTILGPPDNTYYTKLPKKHRKPPGYFLNYKRLGLDIMFSYATHRLVMIVLHNNIPGHAHFSEYDRAFFTLTHTISEDEILDITYHTFWKSLVLEFPSLGDLQSVTVNRDSNSNSFYPFPSSTLVYLSEHCLLEIHENGYITNIYIATNFSHPKLVNEYTHKRLNLLKQAPIDNVITEEHNSLSVNPFQEADEQKLFDTEYSSKSNAIKYPYKNLPDEEDDFALYSYNPYLEPTAIPFRLQKGKQSDRTNYLLKRIEVSGKTAKVENRVKFEDIAYVPPFMRKTKNNDPTQKSIISNVVSKSPPEEMFTMEQACANSEFGSECGVILDTASTHHFSETASQFNGVSDRQSPTPSHITDLMPDNTTNSEMDSVNSNLFLSVNGHLSNGIDPQSSIMSCTSTKSKPELDSDMKALVEGAIQEEIDFPKIMKRHGAILPILTRRYELLNKVLALWARGRPQLAINELNLNTPSLPSIDPKFYSHLLYLFQAKEFNWSMTISDVLLASILDWIEINSQPYQLETVCSVIKLLIKRFRGRIIGNDPIGKAIKEQFATFLNTLFHTFTRLEGIISESKKNPIISQTLLHRISECHHDLLLFKSKFPNSLT